MQRTRGDHRGPSPADMGSSQSQSRHSWGQRPRNGTLLGCCLGTGFLSRPWPAIIIREPPDSLTARLIVTCAMVWIKKHRPLSTQKSMYGCTPPLFTLLTNVPCTVVHAQILCIAQPRTGQHELRLFLHHSR